MSKALNKINWINERNFDIISRVVHIDGLNFKLWTTGYEQPGTWGICSQPGEALTLTFNNGINKKYYSTIMNEITEQRLTDESL